MTWTFFFRRMGVLIMLQWVFLFDFLSSNFQILKKKNGNFNVEVI